MREREGKRVSVRVYVSYNVCVSVCVRDCVSLTKEAAGLFLYFPAQDLFPLASRSDAQEAASLAQPISAGHLMRALLQGPRRKELGPPHPLIHSSVTSKSRRLPKPTPFKTIGHLQNSAAGSEGSPETVFPPCQQ